MPPEEGLFQWIKVVSMQMSHLSKPQASVLALYSFGMVLTRSCGMSTIACFLAALLDQKELSVRQRLREWCYDEQDKKGDKRCQVDVSSCFAPLLSWVLSWWDSDEQRIALVMDATTLRQTFTVLAVSVVYRGCAIPVARVVVVGNEKGSWQPYWKQLLQHLGNCIPADWTVIVLTDRGLYAKWLYKAIQKQGWHPFMRVNQRGKYRPQTVSNVSKLWRAS